MRVPSNLSPSCMFAHIMPGNSAARFSTATQPKAVAVGADATVFVLETESVEAVRSNQKVFDLPLKYTPSAIAAAGSVVAVGGEVRCVPLLSSSIGYPR